MTAVGSGIAHSLVRAPSSTSGADGSINKADVYARAYINVESLPASGSEEILSLHTSTAGVYKFALRLRSDGLLEAFDQTGTNSIGVGTTKILANKWHCINVHDGTGTSAAFEVRIYNMSGDYSVEISGTADMLATNTGRVHIGKYTNRNGQGYVVVFDSVAIDDSAWPGPGFNLLATANGDGTYTAWTGGWANLDETPPDGATTVSTSTAVVDDARTVTFRDISELCNQLLIKCVKLIAVVSRAGAADGAMRIRGRSGSTNSDTSSNATTGSSYVSFAKMFETDPATGAAWTLSGFNAFEGGVVEKSGANTTNVTAVYMAFEFLPNVPASGMLAGGFG